MLTLVTCRLCVLQDSPRQAIERLDPVLDRINEELGSAVSRGKCGSSREHRKTNEQIDTLILLLFSKQRLVVSIRLAGVSTTTN